MKTSSDIRSLALIGARQRREELRAALAEIEGTIKALQAAPSSKSAKRGKKRVRYNGKFKADVVAAAKATSIAEAAQKYGVRANQIYRWRKA